MPYKFNPITGQLDLVNASSGSSSTIDFDKILTGPGVALEMDSEYKNNEVLTDQDGNVLTIM